jgi:hypothetical protein
MHVEIDDDHDHFLDEALLVGVMTARRDRVEVARNALLQAGAREVHVRRKTAATDELGEVDTHSLSMAPRETWARGLPKPGNGRVVRPRS